MAVDGGYLYWADGSGTGLTDAIRRVPVTGGTVQIVAAVNARHMAFDSTSVYFNGGSNGSGIMAKAAKTSPGSFKTLYTLTSNDTLGGAAVAGGRLFFAVFNGSMDSIAIDGTGETAIVSNHHPASGWPRSIVTDGQFLYWADSSDGIDRSTLSGSSVTTLTAVRCTQTFGCGDLALDSNYVYYLLSDVSGAGEFIARTIKSGGADSGLTVVTPDEPNGIFDFVLDGTGLIWSSETAGTIKSMPLGSSTPTTVVASADAERLAVDAKSIYWWSKSAGKIYRLAK